MEVKIILTTVKKTGRKLTPRAFRKQNPVITYMSILIQLPHFLLMMQHNKNLKIRLFKSSNLNAIQTHFGLL